ncbi:HAD-IA family hydrolase [Candidatus Woesearchaeota archaeon]|jgi:putative hydrolase of the HAD superfamily|nr:HAD-IA family hydrolase [Candidatus Woesearchaeota archaeon]
MQRRLQTLTSELKAIIFDLGGVIFDPHFSSNKFFTNYGKEWNKAKSGEITCDEFYRTVAEKENKTLEDVREESYGHMTVDESIKSLILKLKETYKIGFLSNNIEDLYNQNIKLWNIEEIGETVTSFKDKIIKPELEAMELILKKLNVNKDEVVFIDDNKDTVERYTKAGIKSITFKDYTKLIVNLKNFGVKI